MPSATVGYREFRSGVDRSQGDYPDDHRLLRDAENVVLTVGRRIEMAPPMKRLEVVLDPQTQGYVYAGCKHCVIAAGDAVVEHTGADAGMITTLYFDRPDYCDAGWELLGAKLFRNLVVADIAHTFPGCGFDRVVMRHILDPEDPLRTDPEITKPTYVEDPWCPTNWGPTRPLHFYGKGEIGEISPGFVPAITAASEKLVSSRPDGNVAFSGSANERVWNPLSVQDIQDVGEMWYWLTPNSGQELLQFLVSDRFDKLDDDRAWSAYVLEYLDGDGRWQKFVEVADLPSLPGTYTVRPRDSRFGDRYNEICVLARWDGEPCTWVRWRAQTGGPPITILEGGELVEGEADQRTFDGDGETTQFLTDVPSEGFRLHWSVEILRSDAGGDQVIPLILGAEMHYTYSSKRPDYPDWEATDPYDVGDRIFPTTRNGFFYECTVAGTSDVTEPTWPLEVGGTVVDGTVTWVAKSVTGIPYAEWQANEDYFDAGSFVVPTEGNETGLYYKCVESGKSAGTEPTWPTTVGATFTENPLVGDGAKWEAFSIADASNFARIDFSKFRGEIQGRCDDGELEYRYTTNLRYDTIRYIPAFQPTLWLGDDESVAVPDADFTLENDDGYIRVVWLQNLPAEGVIWTLKFAPTAADQVVADTTSRHYTGGRYIFEGEVWDFAAVPLGGLPVDSKILAGVPHFPLRFGAGGQGGDGNAVYSTPGSYSFDVPAGVTTLLVEAWGAGGGGGGAMTRTNTLYVNFAGGGGGGGGAYGVEVIPVTPGETLTVEVGAGGVAGESSVYVNPLNFPDVCGPNPPTAGGDGGSTLLKRGAVVLAEMGGGLGGKQGEMTTGLFPEPVGGDGGDGGTPVTTGAAGSDGGQGAQDRTLRTAPATYPADPTEGGVGGVSGAGDLYGRGGRGSDTVSDGNSCPTPPEPEAGRDGRVKLTWGAAVPPWFEVDNDSEIPLNGWERYHIHLLNRITTDSLGEFSANDPYFYGNEPGRESLFFVTKQSYYNTIAGKDDAGYIDAAARTQACGEVVALSGIHDRLAVHYADVTHLYAFFRSPAENAFLDRLHFGSRGPTAEFFGSSMLLTQKSFRAMSLSGDNFDSLRDNNYGRAVEDIAVAEIHNARYWPALGVYAAAVLIDGVEQFVFFYLSFEEKVRGWTFRLIRDFTRPAVDSLHDVDQRLYMRTGDLIRYFDAAAGPGEWFDDVDQIAFDAAVAAEADPEQAARLRLEDFKYPARVRFHMNDLNQAGTMKRWLWMDVEQSTTCEVGFYERPEADARRKIGPTFDGTSFHRRRTPLVMRNQAVSLELTSRSLDGWRLEQIILGVAQSRR